MSFKSDVLEVLKNPYGEGTVEIRDCRLWIVMPERGDLYLVVHDDQERLVQLLDGGILHARHPKFMHDKAWHIMCKPDGTILALRVEGSGWSRCKYYYS